MGNRNSGRRPEPTAIKILRGNPGKRPLNVDEPTPPAGLVQKPADLSGRSAKVWDEVAPICLAMGTLTTADVKAFVAYCELQATAELIAVEKQNPEFKPLVMKATVDGDGNVHLEARENPLIRMERHTAGALRPYYEKFGLEPVGRARIHVRTDPAYVRKSREPQSKWAGVLA